MEEAIKQAREHIAQAIAALQAADFDENLVRATIDDIASRQLAKAYSSEEI
jgi:hypothetical protein